jgi:F-type H+-transporting ATPase subunit b
MADTNVLGSLGIDAGKLIWQIVNFSILMFVLTKLLYKPIMKKLDERAKLIKQGIKAAEDSIKKQEEAEKGREKIMSDARKQVEKLIVKAKKDAQISKNEIVAEAKNEADKLMSKKQIEIEDLLKKQEKQLQGKVADLSTQVARKVLQDYLDPKAQNKVLDSTLKKIAKMKV